jgi:hypothetical protein
MYGKNRIKPYIEGGCLVYCASYALRHQRGPDLRKEYYTIGLFRIALRTLLHKLHCGVAPQKI